MLNKTTWPTGLFLCCSALTLWQLEQQGSSNKLNSFQANFQGCTLIIIAACQMVNSWLTNN